MYLVLLDTPGFFASIKSAALSLNTLHYNSIGCWIPDPSVAATSTTIRLNHSNSLMLILRATISASVVERDVSPCSLD